MTPLEYLILGLVYEAARQCPNLNGDLFLCQVDVGLEVSETPAPEGWRPWLPGGEVGQGYGYRLWGQS